MLGRRLFVSSLLPLVLLLGCPSEDEDDDDVADDDDSALGDDDDSVPTFPASPLPYTFSLSGALNESVTIDMSTGCQNYSGSGSFRQQLSGGGWAVRIAVDASYDGAGLYDAAGGASLTIQRNSAGGEVFVANLAGGQTVDLEMEGDDGTAAWGSVTVDGLADPALGAVTIEPATLPIWCPSVVH